MRYSEIITTSRNFQASVNLQFDLNKEQKINSYIPTFQSVSILKQYLGAVVNEQDKNNRATVLIGPYGRGKSHLLLVLSALVGGLKSSVSKKRIDNLIRRIELVDEEAALLARNIRQKDMALLPVIINCNHTDINQSFIIALREAFERAELDDLFPQTYFESAVKAVSLWETDYPDTVARCRTLLKKKKMTVSDLKTRLGQFDREAYNIFCEIYPLLTSGAVFNPMQNTDVVKLYMDTNQALSEHGYSGIFIIFDEFSKYLESQAAQNDMQNFKILQDFSEVAVRSSSPVQIHICCVTHKEIVNYSRSESFKAVDARFNTVYFVASPNQAYELVANSMDHTENFDSFYNRNIAEIQNIGNYAYATGAFGNITEDIYNDIIVRNCFPIHPMSVLALIDISEQVGQNERSLFTFLSCSGENTFNQFINKERNEGPLDFLTADIVYDYFYEQLRLDVSNERIRHNWSKASSALKQVDDFNEQRIIKSISLLNIISDDRIVPSPMYIKSSLNMTDTEFDAAIDGLLHAHIITVRHDNTYAFLTANGVNIQNAVHDKIEQKIVKLDRTGVLNSLATSSYILPRQYNAQHSMLRYFRTFFMEAADFWDYQGDFSDMKGDADGLLIYIISDDYEQTMGLNDHLAMLELGENYIACVSDNWYDNSVILEYQAACELEKSNKGDVHFNEELQLYKADRMKSIQNMIAKIYSPTNENTAFYNCHNLLEDITKPLLLNRELSRVCSEIYSHTPRINNEMINKNHLNAPIRKARAAVIDHLFEHPNDFEAIEGSGPEATIFRAVISAFELGHCDTPNDDSLKSVFEIIDNFILNAEQNPVTFSDLYSVLCAPPYGMRKGVIPIYIAYRMRSKADRVIIRQGRAEREISGELFNAIDSSPEKFTFSVEVGTADLDSYIDGILSLFGVKNNAGINKRKMAVEALCEWYRGLPKFARDHQKVYSANGVKITSQIMSFRAKLTKFEINSHELLFDDIPRAFEADDFDKALQSLADFKHDSDSFLLYVKRYLIDSVIKMIEINCENSDCTFTGALRSWYDNLKGRTKKNIFDSDTNILLGYVGSDVGYDDLKTIGELAGKISGLLIADWSDVTASQFLDVISKSFEKVHAFDELKEDDAHTNTTVILNFDGQRIEKNLSESPIEGLAQTVLSNMETLVDEYADSITPQEKISILLELLKKEIEQL